MFNPGLTGEDFEQAADGWREKRLDPGTRLRAPGINIDLANVLPDAVIGADPVHFWIIEAERCSFLTAFLSRNNAAAKKRLRDIASGTWAWFADEPGLSA